MLGHCWPIVFDAGPTMIRHWVNASCLLGSHQKIDTKCNHHLLAEGAVFALDHYPDISRGREGTTNTVSPEASSRRMMIGIDPLVNPGAWDFKDHSWLNAEHWSNIVIWKGCSVEHVSPRQQCIILKWSAKPKSNGITMSHVRGEYAWLCCRSPALAKCRQTQ